MIKVGIASGIPTPIYQQIVDQIGSASGRGDLAMGDKIPAVRKLASEFTVNPNTVAKAYAILEKSDIIVTRKGSGIYIADSAVSHVDPIELNATTERLDNVIA
jgi:GntR family transcriptional regulator